VRKYDDPSIRDMKIRISGCPNSCGQHWVGDFGFYGNARKIDGKEVPYYMMMLGGTEQDFALAVQSLPARLAPVALERILAHYLENREPAEAFRDYVKRFKVETFKKMTADLAKPAPDADPKLFQDWGDNEDYSLQLGRGECAA
jgi:sulfite reductase beta subunit-like hemoprotein